KKLLEDEETEKDAFNAAITKLGESSQKMGAAMYAATADEAGEGVTQEQDAAAGDDDVVDAEIVDEPESKDEGDN
ncbi:MAG TPA: molecular chaperone DnaK, partial [Marmoricola sp.]|nr:molecular chaperone DnaK [Marmoricola sp.]